MPKRESRKHPPQSSSGDTAHAVIKGIISAVPVAGGPLAELFAYLIQEPLAKRRDEWMEEIAARLQALEERLDKPLIEQLKHDEKFTTVLLNAGQIALRNHQTEKIRALANAVANAALGIAPDDTERALMLKLIDDLTPMHMSLLRLLQNPMSNSAVRTRMSSITAAGFNLVVDAAFPELVGRQELLKLLLRDLAGAGLITDGGLNVTMTGSGLTQKRTTPFGDQFVDFISSPDPSTTG